MSNTRIYFTKFIAIVWIVSNVTWAADIPNSEHQYLLPVTSQQKPIPPKSDVRLVISSLGTIFQDSTVIVGDLSAYSQRTLTALVVLGDLPKEIKDKLLIGIAVTQAINTFCEQISYSGLETSIQTQKALQTAYQSRKMVKEQQRRRVMKALPATIGALGSVNAPSIAPQDVEDIITPTSAELSKLDQDIQNLAAVTGCEGNYTNLKTSLWQNSHYYLRFFELILNLTHVALVCGNLFDYSSTETAMILTYTLFFNEIAQFFVSKLKNYGHTVDFETNKYRKPLPDISDGSDGELA